ncbi:MAG: ABC transporter permease, partial [Gemmatimonadota bacterium]
MTRQLGRRLMLGIGIVLFVVTVTFVLVNLAPGDPARLWVAPGAGQAELEAARHALGLDRPLLARYASWLANFARGDWGLSLVQQRPVVQVILDALPHTLLLSGASLLLTYIGGIVIGVFQALRHRTVADTGLTVTTLIIYGMPAYWLAIMLV